MLFLLLKIEIIHCYVDASSVSNAAEL